MDTDATYNILRSNFENTLAELLRTIPDEEGSSLSNAFNRIAAKWLGYDLEEENYVDGAGDCGIDMWYSHSVGFDIFQTKMHNLADDGSIKRGRFDGTGIKDLQRIRTSLLSSAPYETLNPRLQPLKSKWDFEIGGRRDGESSDPLVVNLILLVLGDGLTAQAQKEFDAFVESVSNPERYKGTQVQFRPALYSLDTLIETRWREQNRDWRDKVGKKRASIDLTPLDDQWIGAKKDVVFYCHAHDLVKAYDDFGYQIFEPNVRAHIGKTSVNSAIEKSVGSRSSRHEFRLLNNGVTITCTGYTKPSANRDTFLIREPGIVNGLQTVVALHSGYKHLSETDKEDFKNNCFVLVRLLQHDAVADISQVVLSTNNQNPMQARNLKSNRSEQIFFEQLFAEKGWFYERKQGAWDAFSSDPQRWRTLSNKRPKHFRAPTAKGRPKDKRIDNEELAQTWLSFIGFSREAANLKKDLFDDKWYEFIFLRQPSLHAAQYDYQLDRALSEGIKQAPDVDLMLPAWLGRELTRAIAPSATRNREEAIVRLNLKQTSTSRELEVQLSEDFQYTLGQVLRGSSLLFVELLGYVLYRSLDNPNGKGSLITAKGLAAQIKDGFDLESAVQYLRSDDIDQNDPLVVIWHAFQYILEDQLLGSWRESYKAAPVKSRFLLSPETRSRLVTAFDHLDEYLTKRELTRVWAAGIQQGQGLYKFIKSRVMGLP